MDNPSHLLTFISLINCTKSVLFLYEDFLLTKCFSGVTVCERERVNGDRITTSFALVLCRSGIEEQQHKVHAELITYINPIAPTVSSAGTYRNCSICNVLQETQQPL